MSKTIMAAKYGGLLRDDPHATIFGQFWRLLRSRQLPEFIRWHYHWMLGEDAGLVAKRRREHLRRNRKQRMR